MSNACLYFQVHQPFRMRQYTIFDIGNEAQYFDDKNNCAIMQRVAKNCYLPANRALRELIARYDDFKVAFSITGTALEQFQNYTPALLDSFEELAATGAVEFLNETSHHSLAFLHDKKEFFEQARMHQQLIRHYFRQTPAVFRNTELVYNNELALAAEKLGAKVVLAEGAERVLGPRSPNQVYAPVTSRRMRLALKNYQLSDDIAFRFTGKNGRALNATKYADALSEINGDTINLFLDYETFGEHYGKDTGIFTFLKQLPAELKKCGISFQWPSELAQFEPLDTLDIAQTTSWADTARDVSAWLGNRIQRAAAQKLYALRDDVLGSRDKKLIDAWRKLTTSDHFYYMCTKWFADGDVHKYFNPHASPYEAFIAFTNILKDLQWQLKT
jgi:alpha-amylase